MNIKEIEVRKEWIHWKASEYSSNRKIATIPVFNKHEDAQVIAEMFKGKYQIVNYYNLPNQYTLRKASDNFGFFPYLRWEELMLWCEASDVRDIIKEIINTEIPYYLATPKEELQYFWNDRRGYELSFGRTNKHGIRIHLEMYKSESKMWTMNIQVFKVTDSSSEFIDQRSDILDKKLSLKQALDWFKGWLAIPDNQELIYKIAELEPTTF